MTKHVFVTGGVISSLGKGITAASIAMLLKNRGYRVTMQKLDPYLNVDPGTMSPHQHGEVFVTEDGAETDLDLGHYERFIGINCSKTSNYTTGRIYMNVIQREREGGYLGGTVQVIPHITNEIKQAIRSQVSSEVDIAITEIGGTAGDIESLPYLEAIRQFRHEVGGQNALFVHLTLVPYIKAAGEMKTKPSQQSVGIMRGIGIIPDILVCRCEHPLEEEQMEKLALFCNVPKSQVFEAQDVKHNIYEIVTDLADQDLDVKVLELLNLPARTLQIDPWRKMIDTLVTQPHGRVSIAIVGKYIGTPDAYKSIVESLTHGGISSGVKVDIKLIDAEFIESEGAAKYLAGIDGILVPGGFGDRGVLGKMMAVQYARENLIPFFGICLGMQMTTIEFARNVCGLEGAHSAEFNAATAFPVIDLMEAQKAVTAKGGTMRLGAYPCVLTEGTKARKAYGTDRINERHRHRYEFNSAFREQLESKGMVFSGINPDSGLVEIVELSNHPWFVGCQFHPEFKSRPLNPHPLFRDFVAAATAQRDLKK